MDASSSSCKIPIRVISLYLLLSIPSPFSQLEHTSVSPRLDRGQPDTLTQKLPLPSPHSSPNEVPQPQKQGKDLK